MVKRIEFASKKEAFLQIPKPSKSYVPEWYKKAEKYIGGVPYVTHPNSLGQPTFKACSPFLDSFLIGYTVELWQDIEITQSSQGTVVKWDTQPDVLASRDSAFAKTLPIPNGYSSTHFAWKLPYAYKTPAGYSAIVTNPFNRMDLPFTTMTGIVDSDNGIHRGNLPVLFRSDFEGIIKQGTPIAQIIPFKRESWESFENPELMELSDKYEALARRVVSGWYKANLWKRKDYK